jgi:two-component system, OmpR family, sensor histidine kinase KdpD
MRFRTDITRAVAVLVTLAGITFLYRRLLPVNPTTVSLTLLILVLLTSAWWGFRIALLALISGTVIFNFFFLPPYGTFTIADPQNWIALFAFLLTAVVASNLSERARREAEMARQRRQEVERLYSLSQQLLTSGNTAELFNHLPRLVADTFGAQSAALTVSGGGTVYQSTPSMIVDREALLEATARGEVIERNDVIYLPLRIGVRPVGAFAMQGIDLSRETLEAIGSLVGIAAERARAIDELASTRAEQESEKLRNALLDSVAHEFRTPLTSIKASVTGLLDDYHVEDAHRELLTVIDEEADRLNRLVGEAAEMAQLDAHMFTLDRRPHAIKDVVAAALESARTALQSHQVSSDVPIELPLIEFDFDRVREVLIHLLENAGKYSPEESAIRISAEQTDDEILINVADQGSGIDAHEQLMIFEKFYRGREHRLGAQGTGMGLAISKVIIEAHGGRLALVSQVGHGSVFTVTLPKSFTGSPRTSPIFDSTLLR